MEKRAGSLDSIKAPPINQVSDNLEGNSSSGGSRVRREVEQKICPPHYYCVALYDDPRQTNIYHGFCCPIPDPYKPQCPVGVPHESSKSPNYGCSACPWDHYCHLDGMVTQIEICCPKPCISPEDLYVDGQCYPMQRYGEKCSVSSSSCC